MQPIPNKAMTPDKPCGACKGTGKAAGDQRCPVCRGTGKAPGGYGTK